MKRIVISNRSGNTGKSTLAKHWLKPRMGAGTFCVAIEGRNSTPLAYADETIRHSGNSLYDTLEPILIRCRASDTPLLIDVGSSCEARVTDFLLPVHSFIDLFVVPSMPDVKQIHDTWVHVSHLLDQGVPAKKIVVVRNGVEYDPECDVGAYEILEKGASDLGYSVLSRPIHWDVFFRYLYGRAETTGEMARLPFLTVPGKPAVSEDEAYDRKSAIEFETMFDRAYAGLQNLVKAQA
ncbi:hypothetical protein [Hydrogenophaga sp. 2FB]|uniref:hypothetical protein n=1 Tax=Hydrogenophaga sp. 2FB TaxID=2502187 RepID=UPI0010F8D3B7|nr:hypothetical protein [Hydrogenophaga sp. 2FB]